MCAVMQLLSLFFLMNRRADSAANVEESCTVKPSLLQVGKHVVAQPGPEEDIASSMGAALIPPTSSVAQRQIAEGCSGDAWFNGGVDDPRPGSANPWQFSTCNRSKLIWEDLQRELAAQHWLTSPRNVLSFGCSVGYEAREARGRYPGAEVWGYDIESSAIEAAKASFNMNSLFFTSDSSKLPQSFDLVMMNNVLYSHMTHAEVRSLLNKLVSFAAEDGLVEITIFDPDEYCYPGDVKNSCEGFGFDPKIAWDVLHELVKEDASMIARTNYGMSFMFVAKGPFNISAVKE